MLYAIRFCRFQCWCGILSLSQNESHCWTHLQWWFAHSLTRAELNPICLLGTFLLDFVSFVVAQTKKFNTQLQFAYVLARKHQKRTKEHENKEICQVEMIERTSQNFFKLEEILTSLEHFDFYCDCWVWTTKLHGIISSELFSIAKKVLTVMSWI